jgi:hypothetical protein
MRFELLAKVLFEVALAEKVLKASKESVHFL